jgi:hypothetical protein
MYKVASDEQTKRGTREGEGRAGMKPGAGGFSTRSDLQRAGVQTGSEGAIPSRDDEDDRGRRKKMKSREKRGTRREE